MLVKLFIEMQSILGEEVIVLNVQYLRRRSIVIIQHSEFLDLLRGYGVSWYLTWYS